MKTISAWAAAFHDDERPAGNILAPAAIVAQAVAAARFYAGYAALETFRGADEDTPDEIDPEITPDTELSVSEWAIVRPLFLYYVERETAIELEASRVMGVDVFGRSVSEVQQDIAAYEAEMSHKAFRQPIVTV